MTEQKFIPVGALGEGFAPDADILPTTGDLAGRTFALDLAGPTRLAIGDGVASWDGHVDVPVRVTSIRDGVYLVDGVDGDPAVSTTFVLDVDAGLVTRVTGSLPDAATRAEAAYTRVQRGDDPTGVEVTFEHGTLDGGTGEPHAPTSELVGLRNLYEYSPNESYEHIYLNESLYTWHCLSGVEAGLADTDRCHTIHLRDRLTLFVWREKIVPTLGVILIDLERMKTDGKIFGNDGFDVTSTVNFPVGARVEILNVTVRGREIAA